MRIIIIIIITIYQYFMFIYIIMIVFHVSLWYYLYVKSFIFMITHSFRYISSTVLYHFSFVAINK